MPTRPLHAAAAPRRPVPPAAQPGRRHEDGPLQIAHEAACRAAFDGAGTAIVVTDAGLRIVAANAAYGHWTGRTPAQLIGTRLAVRTPHGDLAATLQHADSRPGDGGLRTRVQCLHRNGQLCSAWMVLTQVRDRAGALQAHVATFTDLGALEAEWQTLRHCAQHDPLTDLPNRRLLGEELERSVARARRHAQQLALLFIDLDRFKSINDTLGHDAGDAVLQEVARRLRRSVRAEDLVARWGGDEFVVVLHDLPQRTDASHTVAALQRELGRAIELAGRSLCMSACIGVALFPGDAGTADGLVRAADAAMLAAKRFAPGRDTASPAHPAPRLPVSG